MLGCLAEGTYIQTKDLSYEAVCKMNFAIELLRRNFFMPPHLRPFIYRIISAFRDKKEVEIKANSQ